MCKKENNLLNLSGDLVFSSHIFPFLFTRFSLDIIHKSDFFPKKDISVCTGWMDN